MARRPSESQWLLRLGLTTHRLASFGSEQDQGVLALLIDHEEALRQFGRCEQAGDSERSLDLVEVVLARLEQEPLGSDG